MGLLAESKTRRKIQHDPNNTRWTRDTTTFGQKMLRSQGWEPGQYLGAKDAAHSEFHTAANASYIRVSLKDDMKGLGYSKSKEDEVTGLDVFSDLLSRLNGKSEAEVEEKKQARLQVKMHQYVEQKWGPMRFVYGGLLVGDAMQDADDESKDSSDESEKSSKTDEKLPSATKESKKEKSKKRKAASLKDEDEQSSDDDDEKKKKKQRKEKRRAKKMAKSDSNQSSDSEKAKKEKKRDKKEKKKSKKDKALNEKKAGEDAAESEDLLDNPSSSTTNSGPEKSKSSKKEKKEKKDKKDKKDKDKKKRKKNNVDSDTELANAAPKTASALESRSGTATPIGTGTSTPNRNFVRSRFIAQKRAAFMDAQALNQIFMVKA
ncbi:pin2-interacting x1 [Trichoderma arundinaceum]|uniref:PinX1-related protein 1 n=1 Tax=Trichoderma arundinaceum TaxID=490622 RepID=A0A395NJY0_TRIAR|nr:pin2-interacting x1 [Trichoderma arundinaceum]